jgi:purine-cytosine permease-like protein
VTGHLALRGRYVPEDLQVFNVGETGGAYWFTGGWNFYALAAWIPSVVLGLLFANTPPLVVGPWAGVAGGIDLSFLSAALVALVVYGAFILLIPDRVLPPTSAVPTLDLATAAGIAPAPAPAGEIAPAVP